MMNQQLKTGTTTLAIMCKNGIVMAADKRATAGHTIASTNVVKVYPITDSIAITIAGSVSDIQLITKYVKAQLKLKKLQNRRDVTVKEAVNLLANLVYSNIRNFSSIQGITHFIIGGIDSKGYHIYDLYPDGSISEETTFISSGSGSPMVYGVLETNYDKNILLKDGKDLAVKAIKSALKRDSASGNGINVLLIEKKGISTEQILL